MEPFQLPGDEEIGEAYLQGKETVIALFHQLAARIHTLEDCVSSNRQFLSDEIDQSADDQPDANGPARLSSQEAKAAAQNGGRQTGINQGDIYWVPISEPGGLEPDYIHPHVVLQANVINRSRIQTVVVCALTSNRKRANLPGNVLLEAGEANLPRQSVVEVSKISTVDKMQLGEYIGSLTEQRVNQILAGMQFLQTLTEPRE